jgi:acyl carrier protein
VTEIIERQVERVVADLFNLAPTEVGPHSSPEQIEAWDSMQHLNLVLALEQQFSVQFGPEQIERMKSVREIVQVVNELRGI